MLWKPPYNHSAEQPRVRVLSPRRVSSYTSRSFDGRYIGCDCTGSCATSSRWWWCRRFNRHFSINVFRYLAVPCLPCLELKRRAVGLQTFIKSKHQSQSRDEEVESLITRRRRSDAHRRDNGRTRLSSTNIVLCVCCRPRQDLQVTPSCPL